MTTKKYISLPRNEIYRSIPQMLHNHLPGSIRSFGNYYYLLKKVIKTKEDLNILNIIYSDLIHNLLKWIEESFKNQKNINKTQVNINDFFSIYKVKNIKLDISLINENTLISTIFPKENFITNEIALMEDKSSYHFGEYFPHNFRCSSCNKIVFSEGYPQHTCCNDSKWIQLSVFLISPDGRIDSIGRPTDSNGKTTNKFYQLQCRSPRCGGHLMIKESNQAKNYKLICSNNLKHDNSFYLEKSNFMLYSIFNSSIFNVHTSEVINFDFSSFKNPNSTISDQDFIRICETNLDKFDLSSKVLFTTYQNNKQSDIKKTIIQLNQSLFEIKNKSIHLDLNNPSINQFCHNEIYKKIGQTKTQFEIKENDLIKFDEISLIDEIEVINYSYGFSRISDKPIPTSKGQIKFNFFYSKDETSSEYSFSDKSKKKQIFYSKEQNKGLYFKFSSEDVLKKLGLTKPTEDVYIAQNKIYENKEFELIFTYLHSLAHFFIKTISQHFSGINTSSLSEMIFPHEYAFVIYKTGTGKDLGYLESFFEEYILGDNLEFFNYINNSINLICPAFELCEGACIECLYTNKHSCKYGNNMLNRDLIKGITI